MCWVAKRDNGGEASGSGLIKDDAMRFISAAAVAYGQFALSEPVMGQEMSTIKPSVGWDGVR